MNNKTKMHWTQTDKGKALLRRRGRAAWKRRRAEQDRQEPENPVEIEVRPVGRPRKRTLATSSQDELQVLTQIMALVKRLSRSGMRYLKDRI
jgi:hypothetical protein